MALNFEKAEAFSINKIDNAGVQSKALAPDKIVKIATEIFSDCVFQDAFGQIDMSQIKDMSAGTVTLLRRLNSILKPKKEVGLSGHADEIALDSKTFAYTNPLYWAHELSQFDIIRGFGNVLEDDLRLFLNNFKIYCEKYWFSHIFLDAGTKEAFDFSTATDKEALDKIIEIADNLRTTENEFHSGLIKTDITIVLSPKLFKKIASVGLNGNGVFTTMINGTESYQTIFGYRVMESIYLEDYVAVIGYKKGALALIKPLASNLDRKIPTNDPITYSEATQASGLIEPEEFAFIESNTSFVPIKGIDEVIKAFEG